MLNHGGRIQANSKQYGIPVNDWLDLSTGINPHGWPVPEFIPTTLWQRLPEAEDDLIEKAKAYYQCEHILPMAGSQSAIQLLPRMRPACRVAILSPAYQEYRYCWQQAGHAVSELESFELDQLIDHFDVVIVVHPNNPTGETFSSDCLLNWYQRLQKRGGWLIVDEAFIDIAPAHSLASLPVMNGLIILRSLGKFFGLAGLRVGFVITHPVVLNQLTEKSGPWPIASVSRWIASQALADTDWQKQSRQYLPQYAQRLFDLLTEYDLKPTGGCGLFQWIKTDKASHIHQQLAQQGILCRLFDAPAALRFGLPASEHEWLRLETALQKVVPS
ncbi:MULTISPECIES: threonine-phosphate decarboxylase CobD [unclassified Methylophaga]|jgi:cobalamin biosynthetic protein CobC|uniref:threonine-phosphate decarboxylase CobD n=1 Tax=unclassified Methylophaga TaxID=2629249 RepID=UPI000C8DE6A8|nr:MULTISPECIES: threonine-phosphate decarboxylase CobD [unclassified Methylophaga]MAY17562.1 threonine-phosphate decarboxylase [Methylophaga sp.]MBN47505.1 threonine-phosphate decarboxylase [Methylophaga sp.]HAO26330.1 threonine-phosphate decarboxylase [Methylophaga sp.]|tara:strand:- start:50710 stop:51699 length:990 start_codon:yes stop_codon:yes gene_type:complete